jgi:hypothetical protein
MPRLTADVLKKVARMLERDAAQALYGTPDPTPAAAHHVPAAATVWTQGNLQDFPRTLPRAHSLEESERAQPDDAERGQLIPAPIADSGRAALRETMDRAVGMLYAVAALLEARPDYEIPPALVVPIQPYIDAYEQSNEPAPERSARRTRR